MRKQINYLKLEDGKIFIETSRTKLARDLKNYIRDNDKINDGWYYPSRTQLDNLVYNKVENAELKFIVDFKIVYIDELFNIEVPTKMKNGKPYSSKYLKNKKNNLLNKKYEDMVKNNIDMDLSKFRSISIT